tara:strand:+ start:80 stop:1243 length:1164 start_codon:yes stop_codon:yes gene_type:complete
MRELNPIKITSDLIKCKSITPRDDGAIALISKLLMDAGFKCQIINRNGIQNLFARWGEARDGLTFCFNGHTDVVPPGALESWSEDPFSGTKKDGLIYGRGAADMKSALAAFISAAVTFIDESKPNGSIVLAITGDEEGEAKDGTVAILDWMKTHNEQVDHCLVGEPTSKEILGDTIKIGRRGSLTAKLTAIGIQGHVAYPEKAKNPLPALTRLLLKLEKEILDQGNEFFDPSSLVITSIDTGNAATNVIPEKGEAILNIRFNNLHSDLSLKQWLTTNVQKITEGTGINIEVQVQVSAKPFISEPGEFVNVVSQSIKSHRKIYPTLSTSGGTSDARFFHEHCPVVEFGVVGKTMHKANENVEIEQIKDLSNIYKTILKSYFETLALKN